MQLRLLITLNITLQKLVEGYTLPQNNLGEWILTKHHFLKSLLEKLIVYQEENDIFNSMLNILINAFNII